MKKRLAAVAMTACLAAGLCNVNALAVETTGEDSAISTENVTEETGSDSADATAVEEDADQLTDHNGFIHQVIEAPRITPDEEETCNSLDSDGNCALKDGNYVRYIDRVDVPEKWVSIYDLLIEGADNDGVNDFLINGQTDDGEEEVLVLTYENVTKEDLEGDDYDSDFWLEYDQDMAYYRAAYQSFDRDYPEVFWIRRLSLIGYVFSADGKEVSDEEALEDGKLYTLKMYVDIDNCFADNYKSIDTIKADIEVRDQVVAEILAEASEASGNDAEKVKYFNDWLTQHNEYNTLVAQDITDGVANETWECISALKGQIGDVGPVCEAYARAMKVLCDAADIPCVLVDGAHHMWNNIAIDGIWYGMDVTWNDPVVSPVGTSVGAVSGRERNMYTLVGGDTLQKGKKFKVSHPVANQWYTNGTKFTNGPQLNSTFYDWNTGTAHVHTENDAVIENETEATCEADGYYDAVVYCGTCGTELSRVRTTTDSALGHDYVLTESKEATAYAEGEEVYTCSRCGNSYTTILMKIDMIQPSATTTTISAAAGSSKKITFTGCFTDYANIADYYDVTAHGIVYMTAAKLGTRELTINTSGRTKVSFSQFKSDGSFSYTIRTASTSTSYVARSYLTYKNADGTSVTVYSDPVTVSYNSLK